MPALALHCPLLPPEQELRPVQPRAPRLQTAKRLQENCLKEGMREAIQLKNTLNEDSSPPFFVFSSHQKGKKYIPILCCCFFFPSKFLDYTHYHISLITNSFTWFSSIIDYIVCLYTVHEAQENNVAQSSIHHA